MLCQDIMRRPVQRALVGETVQSAAQTMRDANIGFLPVCDATGRTVGVVTDRDIAVRLCAAAGSAADTAVETIMTAEVVSCHAHDDLRDVERLMATRHKSRIVVTDDDGSLAGVVSLSDVAAHAGPDAADTLREVATREVLGTTGRKQGR